MLRRGILIALLAFAAAEVSSTAGRDVRGSDPSLPSERDGWNRIQSAHFTVFSDAPEGQTRRIVANLERFRSVLSAFHSRLVIDPPRPTLLFIFKSDKGFQPYKPRIGGRKLVGGYMTEHKDSNYLAAEVARGIDPSRITYHEFLHQFMTVNLPNVPVWFNEGIAEYYSTFQAGENSVKVGLPIEGHVDYLMSHPMIPLRDLFQVDRESPEYNETARMGTFYAESWVVVHYLLNGNSAALRPRVGTFLDKLRGGVPLDQAFTTCFGMGYDDLQSQVKKYVRSVSVANDMTGERSN